MRVIAGSAKKMRLKSPKGTNTRPTADRVKESVFNILAPRVVDSVFLDLFAGAGGMAIEALSRGAKHAVVVENDPRIINVLKENLKKTKLEGGAEIIIKDAFRACPEIAHAKNKFDIIYVDPPYHQDYYTKILTIISQCKLLTATGVVVVESSTKAPPKEQVEDLTLRRRQSYGDTIISFYQTPNTVTVEVY